MSRNGTLIELDGETTVKCMHGGFGFTNAVIAKNSQSVDWPLFHMRIQIIAPALAALLSAAWVFATIAEVLTTHPQEQVKLTCGQWHARRSLSNWNRDFSQVCEATSLRRRSTDPNTSRQTRSVSCYTTIMSGRQLSGTLTSLVSSAFLQRCRHWTCVRVGMYAAICFQFSLRNDAQPTEAVCPNKTADFWVNATI